MRRSRALHCLSLLMAIPALTAAACAERPPQSNPASPPPSAPPHPAAVDAGLSAQPTTHEPSASSDDSENDESDAGNGALGEGIGQGNMGTLSHGAGTGTGQGFGNGRGRLGGASSHLPSIRRGTLEVKVESSRDKDAENAGLEVLDVERKNLDEFRGCYETGLRSNPNLAGRVAVRFVIGRDGKVSSVKDNGSDMPDPAVQSCIMQAFGKLSFPKLKAGKTIVTHALIFNPPD